MAIKKQNDNPTTDSGKAKGKRGRGAPARPNEGTDPNDRNLPYFDKRTAIDANGNSIPLDSEGRLTAVPAFGKDKGQWNESFSKLAGSDFVGSALPRLFRALWAESKAAAYNAEAATKRAEFRELSLPEDSPERERLNARRRIQSLREQLAETMRALGKSEDEIATMVGLAVTDPEQDARDAAVATMSALKDHCQRTLATVEDFIASDDAAYWLNQIPTI